MYHAVRSSPGKAVSPSAGNGSDELPPQPRPQPASQKRGWKFYSMCALVITLLFAILSSHDAYKILDSIVEPMGLDAAGITGCSKGGGMVIMAALFYIVVFFVLKRSYCMTN